MNTLLITSGLALGMLATPTLAQVAPPPTQPAKEQPVYTPPPVPKTTAKPAAKPTPRPAQQKMQTSDKGRYEIGNLPTDVPYPKLAQKGPDGRILRLRQLPDIAALRSNPNIGPKSVEKIMPIVYARRYRMELMIIDNLDLYWELTGGLIQKFNLADISEMSRVAEMLKPLVYETTLSQELLNRGILSRVQGGMNAYIVREYKKSITDEIQVLDGDNGLEEVMRFVLDDSILEARLAYNGLLAESISQISGLVKKAGLSSPSAQALAALEKPLTTDSQQQLIDLDELDATLRTLTFDEAMTLFTTMCESRKFPEISPTIKAINVLHERKKVMENGLNLITKDNTGKVRLDTRKRDAENEEAPESAED